MRSAELLSRALDAIAGDDRTGATDLTLRAAEALQEWGMSRDAVTDDVLAGIVRRLAAVQPAMAPFLRLAEAVAAAVHDAPAHRPERVAAAAGRFGREVAAAPRRIADRLRTAELPERRVATYSGGATVRAALLALHHFGRTTQVVLAEARPAMEGRALADALSAEGVATRVVADEALPAAVLECDALWLGADALTPEGLVHKVGTAPLAGAARAAGRPVRVLAAAGKWLGPDLAAWLRLPGAPFDLTPWDRLDTVVSEAGVQTAADARQAVAALRSPELAAMLGGPGERP